MSSVIDPETKLSPAVDAKSSSIQPISESDVSQISTVLALRLGRMQSWYDVRSTFPLLVGDLVCAWLAVAVGLLGSRVVGHPVDPLFGFAAIGLTVGVQALHGLYPACGLTYSIEFRRILKTSLFVSAAMGMGLLFGTRGQVFPWACWIGFSITLATLLSISRPVLRRHLAKHDWWTQPVLIVGNGERAARLFDRLDRCRNEGLRPAGIVFDPLPHWSLGSPPRTRQADSETELARAIAARVSGPNRIHVGPINDLDDILITSRACRLVIADRDGQRWNHFRCFHGVPHVAVPTDLEHHPTEAVRLVEVDGQVEMHCRTMLTSPGALIAKRTLDLVAVAVTAPLWLPVMGAIMLVIKVTDPGPVFFRQSRVGRYGHPFAAIKFRSMVVDADQKLCRYLSDHPELKSEWNATHKLQNDPRVTKIGCFLRKSSLDELPQLFNVLLGEMSLVGPRPIINCSNYDREYIQENPEVFEMYKMVRPGITGLWQVSGRNTTSYQRRIYFDRFYFHNWSVTLDVFILWRTIKTALFREGAC